MPSYRFGDLRVPRSRLENNMCVLIGLIDQPIRKQEKVGWDTNKVGGEPVSNFI